MDRIKGLRQKSANGSFDSLVPFGTDGILVDMLSGLDSEQELKLGGNHITAISENINNSTTTITETYKALDNSTVTYIVETTIDESNSTSTEITIALKRDNVILNSKTITISDNNNITNIEEVLDT